MQSSRSNLSDAVKFWIDLIAKLNEVLPTEKQCLVAERKKQNLTDRHFLCFLLDPRYIDIKLSAVYEESALEFAKTLHPELLKYNIKFRTKTEPFLKCYFDCAADVHPGDWWKMPNVPKEIVDVCQSILCCSPSTASLERLFSTFACVHSKERNRLGVEKAGKRCWTMSISEGVSDNWRFKCEFSCHTSQE